MKNISKVTTKGQVVIPKEFRDKLKITPSTRIAFDIKDDMLVMEPIKKYTPGSGRGILKSKKRASLKDMEKAIEQGTLERYLRGEKNSK